MNKPVAIFSAGIIGIGLLILGPVAYYTLAYGRGNPEAGNFNRCHYWSELDPKTGRTIRNWERKWELTESTESSFAYSIDCWVIGLGFVVVGAGIWVTHCSTRGNAQGY